MCWRLLFVLCVLCYCLQRITLSISEHDWFVPIAYFVVGGVLCFVRYVHLREWIKLYFYQLLTVCNACACAGEYVCFCGYDGIKRSAGAMPKRHGVFLLFLCDFCVCVMMCIWMWKCVLWNIDIEAGRLCFAQPSAVSLCIYVHAYVVCCLCVQRVWKIELCA